jgi:hypothetical protein
MFSTPYPWHYVILAESMTARLCACLLFACLLCICLLCTCPMPSPGQ